MNPHFRSSVWFVALCLSAGAWAQTAAGAPGEPSTPDAALTREATQPGRTTQRVEHIRVEDSGSRVDELRVGGQTQSITVQPKASMPAYDVRPADVTRPGPAEGGPGSAGQRTWKVLKF
jgi:hypothetical protein